MHVSPILSTAASTAAAVVFTTNRGVTPTDVMPPRTVERPAVGNRGDGCAGHHAVALDIAWRGWRPVASNVLRACTNHPSHLPHSDRPQSGIGQLTDPDAEIEPLIYQRDDPVEQQQPNIHPRIFAEKATHQR